MSMNWSRTRSTSQRMRLERRTIRSAMTKVRAVGGRGSLAAGALLLCRLLGRLLGRFLRLLGRLFLGFLRLLGGFLLGLLGLLGRGLLRLRLLFRGLGLRLRRGLGGGLLLRRLPARRHVVFAARLFRGLP